MERSEPGRPPGTLRADTGLAAGRVVACVLALKLHGLVLEPRRLGVRLRLGPVRLRTLLRVRLVSPSARFALVCQGACFSFAGALLSSQRLAHQIPPIGHT